MMPKEKMLHRTRTALGRNVGQAPEPAPPPRIQVPEMSMEARIAALLDNVGKLAGKTLCANSPDEVRCYIEQVIGMQPSVASNAQILRQCGITDLPAVRSGFENGDELRAACASASFGITGADYALADTGSVVLFSSSEEARMISLLPPVHIAVVPRERILTGLDELFTEVPLPADRSSSMVLITGPSRTADIEQILVRGVHGPGEIHVIVV